MQHGQNETIAKHAPYTALIDDTVCMPILAKRVVDPPAVIEVKRGRMECPEFHCGFGIHSWHVFPPSKRISLTQASRCLFSKGADGSEVKRQVHPKFTICREAIRE